MKYIYIILLAVLASACFGPKENKETAKAEPADSIKGYYGPCVEIDSIVHRFTATEWTRALPDGEGDWEWDEWHPKNIEVLLSQEILVGDEPAQLYHITEKGPWLHLSDGIMMSVHKAIDQDGQTCSITLEQDDYHHVQMTIQFKDEMICYDMTEEPQTAE